MPPQIKITGVCLVIPLLVFLTTTGTAQQPDSGADRNAQWLEVDSSEEISGTDQLLRLTDLLLEWGAAEGWNFDPVWTKVVELLGQWEASSDIETARTAYLRILNAIGWDTLEGGGLRQREPELREFYQRALRITRNSLEESELLFHLAASIYRSEPDSMETRRRIEAYLEQASLAAGTAPVAGPIHLLMGKIYAEWGQASELNGRDQGSYYPKAVFHYQYIASLPGLEDEVYQDARAALDDLLQSGLELQVSNRYDPEDDIRITVSTRNISELDVRLTPLPWLVNEGPRPMAVLNSFLESIPEEAIEPVLQRRMSIRMGNRVDWQSTEILVGGPVNPGWYELEVAAGQQKRNSLLLVTSLEAVLVPHSDSLTLWTIDSESAAPVENVAYHVFNSSGDILFSGFSGSSGLADIVFGEDQSWSEVHLHAGGNPAVLRKSDLFTQPENIPWIVPGSVRVYPGDLLEWTIINPGNSTFREDTPLVILPDGGTLIAKREDELSGNLYSVQMPVEVDSFGPIYLRLQDGKSLLLSHLQRPNELPLLIDLEGERFSIGKNIFVSSAPVGVRIYQDNQQEITSPGYIRVVAEKIDRPVYYQRDDPQVSPGEEQVFEYITRFGDSGTAEAFWELPEIQQASEPVCFHVKVYPLDSEELLAEVFLATVPYRARVSMSSDEHIIRTGESISISVLDVERAITLTRPPQGELVAYRENWENRYVHRKKGTILSEEEFNELPDRSLLGSAKTDYRLMQRRIVREEIFRRRLDLSDRKPLPIQFERHGYYRIEFQGRDADVLAHYPEGPLEVWVIPDDGNLDAFTSERSRLIVEETSDGDSEVLVLVDRNDVAVLLDLQNASGSSQTKVIQPDSSAIYLVYQNREEPLLNCLAVVAGERQTDLLCHHFKVEKSAEWDLSMERVTGLSPGSEFQWEATASQNTDPGKSVWAIFPELEMPIVENLLKLQQLNHRINFADCYSEFVALNSWLPLILPIGVTDEDSGEGALTIGKNLNTSLLEAIYPETLSATQGRGGFVNIGPVSAREENKSVQLTGELPSSAGRWTITAFTPSDLVAYSFRSWVFSTELPIRAALRGPPVIRSGDVASLTLDASNTTRRTIEVNIQFQVGDSLILLDSDNLSLKLESGGSVPLPVNVRGNSPGKGRLDAVIQGPLSRGTASWEAEVVQKKRPVTLQAYFIPQGMSDWSRTIKITDRDSIQVLVSSGIGAHLQYIWPVVRDLYSEREPLLTSLTDWALAKVKYHHGLDSDVSSTTVDALQQSLTAHLSNSGISWTPGNPPNPWLSAITLWTIETFSQFSDEAFMEQRAQLRSYMESVLINDAHSTGARIFALRALAVPASKNPRIRPSRIQAKSFLEFFHNREQLPLGQAAMLMDIASSYRFSEEVRLLQIALSRRFRDVQERQNASLWQASLAHLVLGQDSRAPESRWIPLERLVTDSRKLTARPGWEQIGAILNLLASFLWDGDFSVDGSVDFQSGDLPLKKILLQPNADNSGQLMLSGKELSIGDAGLNVRMDSSASDQPVILTVFDKLLDRRDTALYERASTTVSREYVERTLLAGSHVYSMASSLQEAFHPDDILRQTITLQTQQSLPHVEFTFMVPAGASLRGEEIQYNIQPSSTDAILSQPLVTVIPSTNSLVQKLRIEPFASGKHEFVLPFRVTWNGSYNFPPHGFVYPDSGISYQVGSPEILTIQRSQD